MKKIFKSAVVIALFLIFPVILTTIITAIVRPDIFNADVAPLWFSIPAYTMLGLLLFGMIGWLIMEHKGKIISGIKEFINS